MSRHDDHAHLKQVFDEVRRTPREDRGSALDRLCAGDRALRSRVEALLRHDDRADASLDRPVLDGSVDLERARRAATSRPMPESIGGYPILEQLGDGGMGIVYRARQDPPGRDVALKVLRSIAPTPEQTERFRREAVLLGQLQHPGIPQLFHVGEHRFELGLQTFLVFELVRGEPLLDHAIEHGLTLAQRVELFATACDPLAYAHERGVVHRDIKPGHVLVDDGGRPRLIDFGIARTFTPQGEALTRTGILMGTLQYSSPEQLRGGPATQASDVYGLGLLLFELLTEQRPYELSEVDPADAIRLVCDRPIDPSPLVAAGVPRDLRAIIRHALARQPQRRYANARELADDLRRFLAGSRVRARPTAPWMRPVDHLRDRPFAMAAALVGAAVVISLVAAWSVRRDRAREDAASADRAWRRGHLIEVADRLDDLTADARPWLSPELQRIAAALHSGGDTPIGNVIRALRVDGHGGQQLACRYLERDGAAAHPGLLRFLAAEIEAEDSRDTALALAARLFFERPDDTPEATERSEPIRAAIAGIRSEELSREGRLLALCAWSGCGAADEAHRILEWCRGAAAVSHNDPGSAEEIRMCLIAMSSVARRSRACGFAEAWPLDVGIGILDTAYGVLGTPAFDGSTKGQIVITLHQANISEAYLRRWVGAPPGNTDQEPTWRVRAIHGDPEVIDAVTSDPASMLGPADTRADASARLHRSGLVFETLGLAADRPDLVDAVIEGASVYRLPAGLAREFFESGIRDARDADAGRRGVYDPDDDTHLGAWFDGHDHALEPAPIVAGPAEPGDVARWTMGDDCIHVSGSATAASWRNTITLREELETDIWYARLGLAGAAELELAFETERQVPQHTLLEISVIKARRGHLPHHGQAFLTVQLDDATLVNRLSIDATIRDALRLPIALERLGPGTHRLRIQLDAASNTTVRIHRAAIRRR